MAQTQTPEDIRPEKKKRSTWKTALWILLVAVIVIILAVALFMRYQVRRAFPDVEGTQTLPGLTSEVEVIRDSMGVPHIYADTVEDLFAAQGYVHAQDRFWQMDFWRHLSTGTLSEMFGSSQVDTDVYLRTMGWGGLAEGQYAAETPENRAILDAYARGVNAYLEPRSPSDLAFEYSILELLNHSYDPEAWTGAQSLAWGKVMSFSLGGNLLRELQRAMTLGIMSADRTAQLFPEYPGDRHPFIVQREGAAANAAEASFTVPPEAMDKLADAAHAIQALHDAIGSAPNSGLGSNSWAVDGQHTPTGMPMLVNDPHLGMQMPSIWYQVGLHCRVVSDECPFDVAGFSFAGVPGVIIGHNADIAWGFTNVGPDVQDVFIEKINPDNPNQYEFRGEWLDMELRPETIAVGGGEPVEVVIRHTIHGPIITDVIEAFSSVSSSFDGYETGDFDAAGVETPDPYELSMRWTGLDEVPSIAGPILGINTASNFEEFREAALLFSDPAQNLLYADTSGNIGYQMPGNIPIRANGDGTIPVPGWTGEFEWTGFIPYDELPSMYNPSSGWIVTANNSVIDDMYPYLITEDWSYGYRAQRIEDLVTSNFGISLEEHATIQFDSYDFNADHLLPLVLGAVTARIPDPDEHQAFAIDALTSWDLQNFAGSSGAAVWNSVWSNLLDVTFNDELTEFLWPDGGDRWFEVMRDLSADPEDEFWDDVTTPQREVMDDMFVAAFVAGVDELRGTLGDDTNGWRWGRLHTITFENPTLGTSGIGIIEDRFNRGPYEAHGSKSVPNAVGWDADVGYEVDWIPSMRMLVDLADLRHAYAIHSTGQSGHTDHPHYDDMIPIWLAGDNVPMLWNRVDIENDAEAIMTLVP